MSRIPVSWTMATAMLALAAGGCGSSTSSSGPSTGPDAAAEATLKRVASEGAGPAYAAMAPEFRAITGPEAWRAMVQAFDLPHFQKIIWSTAPDISGDKAKLKGELFIAGALAAPVGAEMARDSTGAWQVAALRLHKDPSITAGEGAKGQGAVAGTPTLSGEQLGEACRMLLARSVPFEKVSCIDTVPIQAGAGSLCMGFLPRRVVGVSARINRVDTAIRDANIHCQITDPIAPGSEPPLTGTPPASASPGTITAGAPTTRL